MTAPPARITSDSASAVFIAPFKKILDAGDPVFFEKHPRCKRSRQHGQVRAVECGFQKRVGSAVAATVALRYLMEPRAFLRGTVKIGIT